MITIYVLLSQSVGQLIYTNYSDIQYEIGVVAYTSGQRIQVCEIVKLLVTVNGNGLVNSTKTQPGDEEIILKIDEVLQEVQFMYDMDFHYKFVDTFNYFHDAQIKYQMPGPHGCVANYRAVSFDLVGEGTYEKIVVKGFYDENILNLSPLAKEITVGDQLISISAVPVRSLIAVHILAKNGASKISTLREIIRSFSESNGRVDKLPAAPVEKFLFKKYRGNFYEVDLPWISVVDSGCWVQSKKLKNEIEGNNYMSPFDQIALSSYDESLDRRKISSHESLIDETGEYQRTGLLEWKTIRRRHRVLGIIRFHKFKLPNFGSSIVNSLRDLLLDELKSTHAILFDLRLVADIPLEVADLIPQLFGSNVKTAFFRARNNSINKDFFQNGNDHLWSEGYKSMSKADFYSPLIKLTSNEDANQFGQIYTKTVGIFTNLQCQSFCALFVNNMKDNKLAYIFGEDVAVAGGGVEILDYNEELSTQQPNYFPEVPFKHILSISAQNFKLSRKQLVRFDGRIIGANGIMADEITRPTISDLRLKKFSQHERIADDLFRHAMDTGKDLLLFQVTPQDFIVTCEIGDLFKMTFLSIGFAWISVFDETGFLLHSEKNGNIMKLFESTFTLETSSIPRRLARFIVQGLDAYSKLAISFSKYVKFVPKSKDYLQIDHIIDVPIAMELPFIGIYDTVKSGAGWIVTTGEFVIAAPHIQVESTLSYFLHFNDEDNFLSIKGSYFTNNLRNFLKIGYHQKEKTVYLMDTSISVVDVHDHIIFDELHEVPQGDIELFIHFLNNVASHSGATIISIDVI